MGWFFDRRIPPEANERLRIAAAVATRQVLEGHVAWALELVLEGAGRAPVDRLLQAYGRLHFLTPEELDRIHDGVLAALGRDAESRWAQRELSPPRSPLRRMMRRLKGRVDVELRTWVDHHTARVQLGLVDVHVKHALEFVRILDGHLPVAAALESYTRTMELRPTTAEFVRFKAILAHYQAKRTARVEPLQPRNPLPLRIADNGP